MNLRVLLRLITAMVTGLVAIVAITPAVAAVTPDPGPAVSGAADHPMPDTVVAPGETLSQLAAEHHVPGGVATIYRLNGAVLPDVDTVIAGQQLRVDDGRIPPAQFFTLTFATSGGKTFAHLVVSHPRGLVFVIFDDGAGRQVVRSYDSGRDARGTTVENESSALIVVTLSRRGVVIRRDPVPQDASLFFQAPSV